MLIKFLIASCHRGPMFRILYHCCSSLRRVEFLPTFLYLWIDHLGDWSSGRDWDAVKIPTWRGREQTTVQSSSSQLDAYMIVHAYSTTMDINHLSDTAGAILADAQDDIAIMCFDTIENINERHFGNKDVPMRSADFWAGLLIRASTKEVVDTLASRLLSQSDSYLDNQSAGHYHRLLLALAATNSIPDLPCDAYHHSISLVHKIFSAQTAARVTVPMKAVRYGA